MGYKKVLGEKIPLHQGPTGSRIFRAGVINIPVQFYIVRPDK
jgi:hypothetical protein